MFACSDAELRNISKSTCATYVTYYVVRYTHLCAYLCTLPTLNTYLKMIYFPRDGGYDLNLMMASWMLGQVTVHSDFEFYMALSFVERQVRSSNERI